MRSFMLGGALLLLSGCAFQSATVHVGEPLEVTNVAVRGPGATPDTTDLVRSRATRMLTRAGRQAHGAPAKVSVDVEAGAAKEGSVYAPSQKRALAVALSRAMASAR